MLVAQPAGTFPGRGLGKIPLAGWGVGLSQEAGATRGSEATVNSYSWLPWEPEKEFTPAWTRGPRPELLWDFGQVMTPLWGSVSPSVK